MTVVVGTRGSALALKQTGIVIAALSAASPSVQFQTAVIRTRGDASQQDREVGDGWFVKEIQRALLDKSIDIAIHSMKDVPTEATEGLCIAAIPTRADVADVMVGGTLASLPSGARVGTGSPRRRAQVLARRPDLEVVAVRGNVPTRIEHVRNRLVDATVLAAAGLARLGLLEEVGEFLPVDEFVPAPGQGAIGVECRDGDQAMIDLCASIEDASTRTAVEMERAVLRGIGGGCLLPFGAHAVVGDSTIRLISRLQHEGRDARVDLEGSDPSAVVNESIARLQ